MALRESFLTVKDEFTMTAPGPGAYNPRVSNYTKGASTLANREQRFTEKADETPGPGSYELSRQSDWLKEKYTMRCPATAVSSIFVLILICRRLPRRCTKRTVFVSYISLIPRK